LLALAEVGSGGRIGQLRSPLKTHARICSQASAHSGSNAITVASDALLRALRARDLNHIRT
jgi:hypothetical protein